MAIVNSFRLSSDALERQGDGMSSPKRIIFLSVEGERTEIDYFNHYRAFLFETRGRDYPIDVRVLTHFRDGGSSPVHCLRLLEECEKLRQDRELIPFPGVMDRFEGEYAREDLEALCQDPHCKGPEVAEKFLGELLEFGIDYNYREFLLNINNGNSENDAFAIVIDRDAHNHPESKMREVFALCADKGYGCYMSTPCFEFWLLLHLEDVKSVRSQEDLEKLLANRHVSNRHTFISQLVSNMAHHSKGISRNTFDIYYAPNTATAKARAASFATGTENLLTSLGTDVAKLIDEIEKEG